MISELFEYYRYLNGQTHLEKWSENAVGFKESSKQLARSMSSRSFSRGISSVAVAPETTSNADRSGAAPTSAGLTRCRRRLSNLTAMVRFRAKMQVRRTTDVLIDIPSFISGCNYGSDGGVS